MKMVSITSDTKGKLQKMIKGVVFSDPYVFITEFMQNAYRAKAKNLYIRLDGDTVTFLDDGKGLRKVSDLLTLDYSAWDSTTEGFGIGFWSWLGFSVTDIDDTLDTNITCRVSSKGSAFTLTKQQVIKAKLETLVEPTTNIDGFQVSLSTGMLLDSAVYGEIYSRVITEGALLPFNVYLNGSKIAQKDILSNVNGVYVEDFSNSLFDARLRVSTGYASVDLYYEKRKVRTFYSVEGVNGIVELKRNSLDLKEPDRKDYVYNDKLYRLETKLKECSKALLCNFIKVATEEQLNEYAKVLAETLQVSDYAKYLQIEAVEYKIVEAVKTLSTILDQKEHDRTYGTAEVQPEEIKNITTMLNTVNPESQWVATEESDYYSNQLDSSELTAERLEQKEKVVIAGQVWRKLTQEDFEQVRMANYDITSPIVTRPQKKQKNTTTLLSVLKKARKKVWVKAEELTAYAKEIAQAEYYGMKVFVANNILYEKVFESQGIPHIIALDAGVNKRNIATNVVLRSAKEKALIQILQPICARYDLPVNTFMIGDLQLITETKLDDVLINKEILKNSRDTFKVYGVTDGSTIILDRQALRLNRFRLELKEKLEMGKTEYRVLLTVLRTVSHELAHLLHGTEDNTTKHFEVQDRIMDEIETLYNELI